MPCCGLLLYQSILLGAALFANPANEPGFTHTLYPHDDIDGEAMQFHFAQPRNMRPMLCRFGQRLGQL
jgi:hypothetical protein